MMQKRQLGCISFTGILSVILTSLALAGLGISRGGAMFSPGDLNAQAGEQTRGDIKTHAETGGRCSACHSAPWHKQTMAERCLACHTELTLDPADFHTVMLAQSRRVSCSACHTDHRGEAASLTNFDLQNFPHLSLGFSLQAHKKTSDGMNFVCSDCHGSDIAQFNITACIDCHARIDAVYTQQHAQDFGTDCLACHDGVDRYGGSFDHNQHTFQLTGKHAEAACAACHAGARTANDMQAARQDCFGCHAEEDPHEGQFGQDCAGCHTPESWENATFDHSLASFALTGAHVNVECTRCHIDNVFKGTPQDCVSCHADPEIHLGLFPADCASCHTTDAWSPAQFNEAHIFPINHGEGGPSSCKTCHPDNLNTYTCYGCHEHTPGEIAAKHIEEGISDFNDCVRCHQTGEEEEGEEGGD